MIYTYSTFISYFFFIAYLNDLNSTFKKLEMQQIKKKNTYR